MKKLLIHSILVLALLFSGCEDNFDPQIYGKLFSSNFPQTEADYESYLLTCYIPFGMTWGYNNTGSWQHTMYVPEGGFVRMFDATADISYPWTVGNWGGGWLQLSQANYANCILYGRASSGDSPSHYEKVRDVTRATEIIGTLEKATVISSEKQKQFIGETRLLRGLLMYYLLHIYGPVPVIVDPARVGDFEAEQNLVRPSLEEM
ncbi:MAG: RagB/SusD family nutrient uptake outer membrane protein, partial [Tannerellaceae bacterium]|nr:RagB/SusD family nutrient uptake outer membrane protein [Tannerellaceae bacterium]